MVEIKAREEDVIQGLCSGCVFVAAKCAENGIKECPYFTKESAMCEANSNAVLGDGWYKPENKPDYYKPIIMFIETNVIGIVHELYIAGYYHTDNIFLESCGGNMDQEFDNYKLKAWAYIKRPAFA